MNTNDQVHIHTRRIREQPFLHTLHLLEEVVSVVRHKHLVARLERVEHATEEDLNVVASSEQEVRGGASVTALAPLVLALELTDLLRTHAERLAVVPHARGLARNEPKEHIRLISRVASTVMSAAPSLRWLRLAPDRLPTVVAGVRVGCAASSYDEPSSAAAGRTSRVGPWARAASSRRMTG